MKTAMIFFIALLTLALTASSFAQMGRGFDQHQRGPWGAQRGGDLLTDDQKQQLHDLISRMREDGAMRGEIRDAVDALFAEWGLDRPARDGNGRGAEKNHPELTVEQRTELRELVQSMKEADATREEIKAAVDALFEEWGLEPPTHDGRWGDVLTAEQQEELRTLVQGMKEAGATREDIKAAVDALFAEWGIERPEFDGRQGKDGKGKKGGRGWMGDLSEEQRAAIRDMIQTMKKDGATREEIRQAVQAQLEEWGIGGENGGKGAQMIRERKNIQASNAPNPFNPTTTITYALEKAGPVSVKVYNTQGRLIRTLVDAEVSEGQHSVMWNGLNDKGEQVSSGMYFYKVTSDGESTTERMMLMK